MPGRKALPIELLLIKGKKNLTKQEIETRRAAEEKLKANDDKVKPPSWFNKIKNPDVAKEAKREFKQIVSEAKELGYITNLDVTQLAKYCHIHALYIEESLKDNPDKAELIKLSKEAKSLASEYGLTPSARVRLAISKQEDGKEETNEQKRFGDRI